MAQIRLYLLGSLQLMLDEQLVAGFESDKARALLAYLAAEADQPHERVGLARLLWPDLPERAAHNNLRGVLANLRQILGDTAAHSHILISTAKTIQFTRESDTWLDITIFTSLLDACDRHQHRRIETCLSCPHRLIQAVELYRGDFLARFSLPEANTEFNEWVDIQRRWFHKRTLDASFHLTRYYEHRGQDRLTHRYVLQQLELDPFCEEAHQHMMRLLARSEQRTAALAHYTQWHRLLAKELGVEPAEETTALYKRIRDNTFDTSAPVTPPTNLPTRSTSLLGRDDAIVTLRDWLLHDEIRLVTLTGAPGIGKTSLALAVANNLRTTFEHGVYFVDLAPLRDHQLVTSAIAQTLGVRQSGSEPLLKSLKEYTYDKQLLLLLDNFEHLLTAAPLIAELLAAAPDLKVLVASRAALRLSGEYQFPVPPLTLPDLIDLPPPHMLIQNPAVELFVQRSVAVQPSFVLTNEAAPAVAELCVRLDGLPLSIELAATHSKLFAPQALLQRLTSRLTVLTRGAQDLPIRQQTLRASIDWSYALLPEHEQTILNRLAVFAGSWTLEAAEAVCTAPGDLSLAIMDGVASLIDKSLVQQFEGMDDEIRFTMLETIREYALERLKERGEVEALRRQHAAYYLALVEAAEPELRGPQAMTWLKWLDADYDNLRAALEWSQAMVGDVEVGLRLVGALRQFWEMRGHLSEGRQWIDGVLSKGDHSKSKPAWAKALNSAGSLAYDQGDFEQAKARFAESLMLFRELGDKPGIAKALTDLGAVVRKSNREQAMTLYEEGLAINRELGDKSGVATSLSYLGNLAHAQGDFARAKPWLEEGLALRQQLQDKRGIAWSLNSLGDVVRLQGDYARASALLTGSKDLFHELDDPLGTAHILTNIGLMVRDQGDFEQAKAHFAESLALWERIGDKGGIAYLRLLLGGLAHDQGDFEQAKAYYEESLGLFRDQRNEWGTAWVYNGLGDIAQIQGDYEQAKVYYEESIIIRRKHKDKVGIAYVLEGMATVAGVQGHFHRAAQLLGAAEVLREVIGVPLPPADVPHRELVVATIRAHLDEIAFATAWARGKSMPLEQAVIYAVGKDD